MKKTMVMGLTICMIAMFSLTSYATTVNFDAVSLRGANPNGSGAMPLITEFASGDGFTAQTLLAGQKVYYGTNDFAGWSVEDIASVSFSWTDGLAATSVPYINLMITDGIGHYGILASGNVVSSKVASGNNTMGEATFNFRNSNVTFYEPSLGTAFEHGSSHASGEFATWKIIGTPRPLSNYTPGESETYQGTARGPVNHGLAIVWGDSAANYLGWRNVHSIEIMARRTPGGNDETFDVGNVPEPATLSLLGLGLAGLVVRRMRRKH